MGDVRDWLAFYTIEGSARDPEPTKWDAPEVVQEKLRRIAQSKLR